MQNSPDGSLILIARAGTLGTAGGKDVSSLSLLVGRDEDLRAVRRFSSSALSLFLGLVNEPLVTLIVAFEDTARTIGPSAVALDGMVLEPRVGAFRGTGGCVVDAAGVRDRGIDTGRVIGGLMEDVE